jgi:hypothetical protein
VQASKPNEPQPEDEATRRQRLTDLLRAVAEGNAPPALMQMLDEAGVTITRKR